MGSMPTDAMSNVVGSCLTKCAVMECCIQPRARGTLSLDRGNIPRALGWMPCPIPAVKMAYRDSRF